MEKKKIGVYKITNIVNSKNYVGSSITLEKRKRAHFKKLNDNVHENKKLQRAYNKFGKGVFVWEVIEYVEFKENNAELKKELLDREQYWMDLLVFDKNKKIIGYNLNPKADSCLGRKLTKEHKRKLSESKKGFKNPMYGRIISDETRRKISEKSKNLSDETRRKISEKNKGNQRRLGSVQSDETRRKISEGNKGKQLGVKRSDETREKISEAGKGRIVSSETRQKKRISMLGKNTKKRKNKLKN